MSLRLVICLLLSCTSFQLMARDVRTLAANGGGGCSDDVAQADDTTASSGKRPAHAARPAMKSKASSARGGDNAGDVRPPRWHSFLPGMFR